MSRPNKDTIQKYPEIYSNRHFATGLWPALVVRVDDPLQRGRVQVRVLHRHPPPQGGEGSAEAATPFGKIKQIASDVGVPKPPGGFEGIPDEALPWAKPCFPFGGQKRAANAAASNGNVTDGFFMLPSVGSTVWVAFELGHTGLPVWLGGWFGDGELPPEITDPAAIRLIKSPAGHVFLMDDTEGAERIFLATTDDGGANVDGPRIRFVELDDDAKTLTLQNSPDQKVTLDRTNQQTSIQNESGQTIVQDGAAGTTTITDGATSIQITAAGVITITNGTATITVDAAGNISLSNPVAGTILLGTAAVQGVCLDSLITVISDMVTKFNTHTHDSNVPVPAAAELQTAPVIGVNSSSFVRAKL